MMTRRQAERYGKALGCKFYVRGSTGGLFGVFKTREAAEDCKRRQEKMLRESPWDCSNIKIYVEEARA